MGLAHMMGNRQDLICDLAETYHIFNYRGYPATLVATLACGLKADSRIKTKMAGVEVSPPLVLLTGLIVDEIRALRASLSGNKHDKPSFITDAMREPPKPKGMAFDTPEEFEQYRRRLIERVKNG